jgi:hypothetical protein
MKNEKKIEILKELIEQEIDLIFLKESWLESNPLYRAFIQPFTDFASVVAAETRKMVSAAWSALNQFVAIGTREFLALWNPERFGYTARSTIIGPDGQPTVTTGDQAFQNVTGFDLPTYLTQERQSLVNRVRETDREYGDVYGRITNNLSSGDVSGITFLLNPGLYIAGQAANMTTGVALDTANTLTGGRVPAIQDLRNRYIRWSNTASPINPRFRGGTVGSGDWSTSGGVGGNYDDYDVGGDFGVQLEQLVTSVQPNQNAVEQQFKSELERILRQPQTQQIINNHPGAVAARQHLADSIIETVEEDELLSPSFSAFESKQPTIARQIEDNIKNLIKTRFEEQAAKQQQQQQVQTKSQSTGTTSTTGTGSTQSSSTEQTSEEQPQPTATQQQSQPTEVAMPTEEQLNQVVEKSFQDAKKAQKDMYVRQLTALGDSVRRQSPEFASYLQREISKISSR